ncbi:MAG: hypothetical protein K8W52_01585 [Deltaproteobacteria bacterium]|nr:hypothetical protein [Deltaproteobacteria bacterium]
MTPILRLFSTIVVTCAIGRAAAASPAVVLESYAGPRPADADRLLKPVYAELGKRGFVLGGKLVTILGETVSRSAAQLSPTQAIDAQRLVEDSYQHFIDGDYANAVALGDRALGIYRSAPVPNPDPLRKLQWKAMIVVARSHEVLGHGEDAFRVMAEAIRTFPDSAITTAEFDPQVIALQRKVKQELARQGTGALEVRVDDPAAVVFVNERFAGTGTAKLETLAPGRYRVYTSKGEVPGRVHEVEVAPGGRATVDVAWSVDGVLRTRDDYAGLEVPVGQDTDGEIGAAVKVARAVGAKSVVVLGIREVEGRRSVIAYSVSTDSQNKVYGAVQLEPIDPGTDTLTKLAALMAGDKSASTSGIITREPAPVSSRRIVGMRHGSLHRVKWIVGGVALAALGTGGALIALDNVPAAGTTRGDNYRETKKAGIGVGIGGAVVAAVAIYMFATDHDTPIEADKGVSLAPTWTGDSVGMALSGRF